MVTCINTDMYVYIVGFDWTDAQAGISYRYKQNNAFDSVADSSHLVYYSGSFNDTGNLHIVRVGASSSTNNVFVIPGYDYKIFLPAVGRIFTITNIVQQGNKTQSYSKGLFDNRMVTCVNNIVSYSLDGNTVSYAADVHGIPLYIVK